MSKRVYGRKHKSPDNHDDEAQRESMRVGAVRGGVRAASAWKELRSRWQRHSKSDSYQDQSGLEHKKQPWQDPLTHG
jgi:hypothetical protein